MKRKANLHNRSANYLISFFLLPGIVGAISGAAVFLFKLLTDLIMEVSSELYARVGENLAYLPLLLAGAVTLGAVAYFFNDISHLSSGGGIPTALAALRGLLPFKWLRTFVCVVMSSVCTYMSGVPLDTEGPAVQIGACVGRGVSRAVSGRFKGADRYAMTGGACAGIAVATGAPISGIFFALEDSHRRFTPTIFISAAVGVISGVFSSKALEEICGVRFSHFIIPHQARLGLEHLWTVLLIAVLAVVINTGILFVYGRMKNKDHHFRKGFKTRQGSFVRGDICSHSSLRRVLP